MAKNQYIFSKTNLTKINQTISKKKLKCIIHSVFLYIYILCIFLFLINYTNVFVFLFIYFTDEYYYTSDMMKYSQVNQYYFQSSGKDEKPRKNRKLITAAVVPKKPIPKLDIKAVCPCGRSFSYKAGYRYHMRWECGQNLACNLCSKTFTDKSNLIKHMKHCSGYKNDKYCTRIT